jgi:hypothetical protein
VVRASTIDTARAHAADGASALAQHDIDQMGVSLRESREPRATRKGARISWSGHLAVKLSLC